MRRLRLLPVIAVLLLGRVALGDEQRSVRLAYAPAPRIGCPDEQALRDMVAAHLGYDPFVDGAKGTVIAGIRRDRRLLRAHVELRDDTGHSTRARDLVSRRGDCHELASTLALAISIAIDPLRFAHPAAPPPPVPAPPVVECAPPPVCAACAPVVAVAAIAPVAPISAPPPPGPATPPPRPRPAVRARLSAGVLGSFYSSPQPAFGVVVQVGLRVRDFSIGIEGRADLPTSTSGPTGRRVEASLLVGSLVPCYHVGQFALCALLTAGVMRGAALDADVRRSASSPWLALGARAAYELAVYRALAFRPHFDLQGHLFETALRVDGLDVWVAPPLSATLGLDVVGAF